MHPRCQIVNAARKELADLCIELQFHRGLTTSEYLLLLTEEMEKTIGQCVRTERGELEAEEVEEEAEDLDPGYCPECGLYADAGHRPNCSKATPQ